MAKTSRKDRFENGLLSLLFIAFVWRLGLILSGFIAVFVITVVIVAVVLSGKKGI